MPIKDSVGYFDSPCGEACSKSYQTSKMGCFVKVVEGFTSLIVFFKNAS